MRRDHGGPSILTTASNLLISGDDQKNVIVFSADKGNILWHHELNANESGGIISYCWMENSTSFLARETACTRGA